MLRVIFLFSLLAVSNFSGISYAGELAAKEVANYYNEALEKQQDGDIDAAIILYDKAILLSFDGRYQNIIYNNLGVAYLANGDMNKALAAFKKALSIDNNYQTVKLNLGFIYEKKFSKLESINYWLDIFNINLEEMKPKKYIILSKGDFGSSEVVLADPKDKFSQKIMQNNAGIDNVQKGNLKAAEKNFIQALVYDGNYRSAQLNLGLIYDQKPDKLKSTEYWLKVFNIDLNALKPKALVIEGKIEPSA